MTAKHFRALENMYLSAPINQRFKPTIHIEKQAARITHEVRADDFHAAQSLHGSVYFKALDDAAYFAVNAEVEDVFVFTVSFNVVLLRPVTKGPLVSEGRLISGTKNVFAAQSTVRVGDKIVATGSGTFMRSKVALESVASYQA